MNVQQKWLYKSANHDNLYGQPLKIQLSFFTIFTTDNIFDDQNLLWLLLPSGDPDNEESS